VGTAPFEGGGPARADAEAPSGIPASARFGVSTGGGLLHARDLGRRLDDLDRLGVTWLRLPVDWATIQAGGSRTYRWGLHDRVLREARRRGIRVVGVLLYTPRWAQPTSLAPNFLNAPARPADLAVFAGRVARRYRAIGVHHWEIWNEPNHESWWLPRADAGGYTRALRAASRAIRRADPRAVVISGGLAPWHLEDGPNQRPADFLQSMYRHGAKPWMDAVGVHPYSFPARPGGRQAWNGWRQMVAPASAVRRVMIANDDRDTPLWATEFGVPTMGPGAVSERAVADMLTSAYALWTSYPRDGPLFWFTYRDDPGDASYGGRWGLVRRDLSRKPSYFAYRAAARR
jgi:polysaccharide biosynthesis protein PslG